MSSYAERSAQAYSSAGYSYPSQSPSPSAYSSLRQSTQHQLSPYESSISFFSANQEREQLRLLSESLRHVQEQAVLIRNAIDKDDLPTVLDKAMSLLYILGDSRTHRNNLISSQEGGETQVTGGRHSTALTAKNYHDIHMRVCEQLVVLEDYFITFETSRNGYSLADLYEMVQYCPRVVPRAYLRICCAVAAIRSLKGTENSTVVNIGSIPFILQELMDTVKCVQCPMPGLFVRYYLLQAIKDVLPNTSNVCDCLERTENEIMGVPSNPSSDEPNNLKTNVSVTFSYDFLINNFVEMNKLWIRIQFLPDEYQASNQTIGVTRRGHIVADAKQVKKRRERERHELRILVGTNITQLSQLEGVTSTVYGTIVLPRILEQIVSCRDPLAQAYLMDCIIQSFADEYHIQTLEIFLHVCPKLREKVNCRTIVQSMMDRLANYFLRESSSNNQVGSDGLKASLVFDSFQMFSSCVQAVIETRSSSMPLKDIVRLEATLLKYILRCIPGQLDLIASCLENCKTGLKNRYTLMSVVADDQDLTGDLKIMLDDQAVAELECFLSLTLDCNMVDIIYNLDFLELISFLPSANKIAVSRSLIKFIIGSDRKVENPKDLQNILTFIAPLSELPLHSANNSTTAELFDALSIHDADSKQNSIQLSEDMVLITQLVHSLESSNTDTWFELIRIMADRLANSNSLGQRYAIPSIVYTALELVEHIQLEEFHQKSIQVINETSRITVPLSSEVLNENENDCYTGTVDIHHSSTGPHVFDKAVSCRDVFVFIQSTLVVMHSISSFDCFHLYLHVAVAADRCSRLAYKSQGSAGDFPVISYEFITQAIKVYDECSADDYTRQVTYLSTLIGTLLVCRFFDAGDLDHFNTKLAQYAARLLRKTDQCKLLLKCAHLFYNCGIKDEKFKNPQRSLECLQRALKIADSCVSIDSSNICLLVDVLDAYIFFYESKSPVILAKYITGLIALIKEHLSVIKSAECMENFKQLIGYIERKKADASSDLFAAINI